MYIIEIMCRLIYWDHKLQSQIPHPNISALLYFSLTATATTDKLYGAFEKMYTSMLFRNVDVAFRWADQLSLLSIPFCTNLNFWSTNLKTSSQEFFLISRLSPRLLILNWGFNFSLN